MKIQLVLISLIILVQIFNINGKTVQENLANVAEAVKDTVVDGMESVQESMPETMEKVGETVGKVGETVGKVGETMGKVGGTVKDTVKTVASGVFDLLGKFDVFGVTEDPNFVAFKGTVEDTYSDLKTSFEDFIRGVGKKAKNEYDEDLVSLKKKVETALESVQKAKDTTYSKISEGLKVSDEEREQLKESWANAGEDLTQFFHRVNNNFHSILDIVKGAHEKYKDKPVLKCGNKEYTLSEFLQTYSLESLYNKDNISKDDLAAWANNVGPCEKGQKWELLPDIKKDL